MIVGPEEALRFESEVAEALRRRSGEGTPEPRLAPTRRALRLLDDPQERWASIHVTGTNGKTSTSRIIESILRAGGERTGLFTSPDLGRITQRICIDGRPIAGDVLLCSWRAVEPAIGEVDRELAAAGLPGLTFFEALTVLAFATFARECVDVAVVEVGVGGEWDATNVIDGDVAVFTPIDLDHTRVLGRTVAEIAATKSGIIKSGATVVSAEQVPEAHAVLFAAARARDAPLHIEPSGFGVVQAESRPSGQQIDVRGISGLVHEHLELSLHGAHQAQNAAVAVAAVEAFRRRQQREVSADAIREGVTAASSPGRFQLVSESPITIVDAAHNPHGVAAMLATLNETYPDAPLIGVAAVLREKDARGMLEQLASALDVLVVTRAPSDRSMTPVQLARIAEQAGIATVAVDDADRAVHEARRRARALPGAVVVVFGSITLASLIIGSSDPAGSSSR